MAFKYFGSTILLISVVVHSTHQWCAMGFAVQTASSTFSRLSSSTIRSAPRSQQIRIASDETSSFSSFSSKNEAEGPEDLVACRITVSGDVHGGYYRACVLNEAGKFRRLSGRMSDPDDTDTAEIYVEGKRKMVEGFVRWCHLSGKKVALNQKITVTSVLYDDEPTGLYDAFYCRIK